MGMSVTVETIKNKHVDTWKPINRFDEFKDVFTKEKQLGKCACGYNPCMCGGLYSEFIVKESDNVGDERLKELLKEYKTLIITFST